MTTLYYDIRDDQLPIVYSPHYNVSFGGFERCHVFDVKKWRNVVNFLKAANFLTDEQLVKPREPKKSDLLIVHTKKYLKSLKWSVVVAIVTEVPIVACVPNVLVQKAILKPMRYQTGGSVLAGKLALERGWAINIGGGFHHCCASKGGGFCPYADITLLVRCLMNEGMVRTAMIVDLDAHQGNGHERDFLHVREVYILDMYNRSIYPRDCVAKRAIRKKVELKSRVDDLEYLLKLRYALREAFEEFTPDIVVYNAGTDILYPDPLGGMFISEHGIIKRDEIVFKHCKDRNIPIVMLTSGGYLRKTARIIANSIMNLEEKQLINIHHQSVTKTNLIKEIYNENKDNRKVTKSITLADKSDKEIKKNSQDQAKPCPNIQNEDENIPDSKKKKENTNKITLAEFLNESAILCSENEIGPSLEFRNKVSSKSGPIST